MSPPEAATAPTSSRARALWRAMRPHQWLKNAFVLAPLVFAGPELRDRGELDPDVLLRAGLGFLAFCIASSATYLLNDLHDVDADRLHPVKRHRPIASGALSVRAAWQGFFALIALSVALGLTAGGWFLAYVGAYFAMNLAYSKGLKRIAWLDAAVISLGFLLRILAGGEAAGVHVSAWLLACTVLLAMFLALGKRKHELLTADRGHRAVLEQYRERHLDVALGLLALLTSAAYVSYTLDAETASRFHTEALPWTAPFALFGLLRFLRLLDMRDTAHSPTERMLRDRPFMANLALWAMVVLALIYQLPGLAP